MITGQDLHALLPASLRTADELAGGMLSAILDVLAEQLDGVDADIERMGEDWFIETCAPWVVPYIGDLVGEPLLVEIEGLTTPRARVANAIAYRRRKGTVAVLEALTRDTTDWPTRAVEEFRLLRATQHLAEVRVDRAACVSLHSADALELVDGPFDIAPHTVDVRRIATAPLTGRSRHNIPNVALHVYRLQARWTALATARAVATPADGRYHVDPLGRDAPLFNRPGTETEIEHLATEADVPAPLRRRPLHDELDQRRADLASGRMVATRWFGERPAVRVHRRVAAGDPLLEVPPEQLEICHLGGAPGWRRPPLGRVSVDPVLGRVALPAGETAELLLVSAAHGFAGDVGAGPEDHTAQVALLLDRPLTWHAGVSRDVAPEPGRIFPTLGEAIGEWNAQPDATVGLITVMDSHLFEEDLSGADATVVGEGSFLAIVAADWPELPVPGGLPEQLARQTGRISAVGVRPVLLGDIEITGSAPDNSPAAGEVVLCGLLVSGEVRVTTTGTNDLGRLTLAHCTLDPAGGGLRVSGPNEHLAVTVRRSVSGPLTLAGSVPSLSVTDSILDAGGATLAIVAPGTAVELEGVTVLGAADVREIEASDCIVRGPLTAARTQVGCVRFSSLARGSVIPRRYRCQPDGAIAARPDDDPVSVAARVAPSFTSEDPADPGYAQLGPRCPREIAAGADDGSEMGAFCFIRSPQRVANLGASLDEYLRFGLDAALIPET